MLAKEKWLFRGFRQRLSTLYCSQKVNEQLMKTARIWVWVLKIHLMVTVFGIFFSIKSYRSDISRYLHPIVFRMITVILSVTIYFIMSQLYIFLYMVFHTVAIFEIYSSYIRDIEDSNGLKTPEDREFQLLTKRRLVFFIKNHKQLLR